MNSVARRRSNRSDACDGDCVELYVSSFSSVLGWSMCIRYSDNGFLLDDRGYSDGCYGIAACGNNALAWHYEHERHQSELPEGEQQLLSTVLCNQLQLETADGRVMYYGRFLGFFIPLYVFNCRTPICCFSVV